MSIKMYLSEVQAQSSGVIQIANAYREALGGITDSCTAFLNAPLSGKTYDSAKTYFTTVYPPIINGLQLACEELAEAHRRFPDEYVAKVEGIDLDEAVLEQQIADAKNVLELQYRAIDSLEKAEIKDFAMERSIMRTQHLISELQRKLEKLREFNAYSPSIFANVESVLDLVSTGLSAIGQSKAWNASTVRFEMNRISLSWAKPLHEKWNEHRDDKEKELEKFLDKLSDKEKAELQAKLELASEKDKANVLQAFFEENGLGLIQDLSLSGIEEYFNKHGEIIATTFYNASARNTGTEIGSALHMGGTISKNLGKAMPIIGCVVDFVGQVVDGENGVDAVNKTLLHFGAGIIIDTVIVGVGIPALPALVLGTIAGSAVSNLIDVAYDGFTEKVSDFIGGLFSWG
ncbi:hypothetical protein RyT2_25550 [Pseudolactococcus yaeyamensis]